MQVNAVIPAYAIGGAVAATFYIEPASTLDIDIFIPFENTGSLVSLTPIYEYLLARGFKVSGEYVIIENWQVQFLPADDDLYREALLDAMEITVGKTPARIMKAEHLMAIALRTGRAKDLIRLEQFVREEAYDIDELTQILARHKLLAKWKQFNDKYISENQ